MNDKSINAGKKVKSVTSIRIDTITYTDDSVDVQTSPITDDDGGSINLFSVGENPPIPPL